MADLIKRLRDVVEEESGYGLRNEAATALESAAARISQLESALRTADHLCIARTGEVNELRGDAERYRWLIDGPRRSFIWNCVLSEEEKDGHGYLEDAINAAIAKESK